MSNLPKIENYPTKKVTLPQSKKKVTVRPFLVREEKILIMAREQENAGQKEFLEAMCQIIESCVKEKIDPEKMNEIDLSYLFLQIRMLSKGEGSQVTYRCKAKVGPGSEEDGTCDHPMEIPLDLTKVEVYRPEGYEDLFKVPNNDVYIQMRMATISDFVEFEENNINISDPSSLKWRDIEFLITTCIDSIIEGTKDDSTIHDDYTREQLAEWLETVPDSVLDDILNKFLLNTPYLRYQVKTECAKCGTKHEFDIVGLENFFG